MRLICYVLFFSLLMPYGFQARAQAVGDAGSQSLSWYGLSDTTRPERLLKTRPKELRPAAEVVKSRPCWLIAKLKPEHLAGLHLDDLQLRSPTLRIDTAYLVRYTFTETLPVRAGASGFVTHPFHGEPSQRILLKVSPLQFSTYRDDIRLETATVQQSTYQRFVRVTGLLSGMVLLLFLLVGLWRVRSPIPLSLLFFLPSGLLLIWAYDGFFWQYAPLSRTIVLALLLLKGTTWVLFWSAQLLPTRRYWARLGLGVGVFALIPLFFPSMSMVWSLFPLFMWLVAGFVFLAEAKKRTLLVGQVFLFLMTLHLSLWILGLTQLHPFLSLSWGTLFVGQAAFGAASVFDKFTSLRARKEAEMREALLHSRLEGLQRQVKVQSDTLREQSERMEKQERQLLRQQQALHARNQLLEEKDQHFQRVSQRLQEQKEELQLQNEEVLMKSSLIEAQKDLAAQTYKQIRLLRDIGQQLNSSLDIEEILTTAYQNITSFVETEGIGIGIYRPNRQEVNFLRFWWNGTPKDLGKVSLYRKNKLLSFALRDKRELLINNFEQDYQKYLGEPSPQEEDTPKSAIYLPLTARREVIGVLLLQHSREKAFNYEQLDMLKSLGQFLAIGLDNAQAYQKIQNINEQMNAKNYQIMSSLRYAQTVQQAILPQRELLEQLFSDHFIIFMPRDLVSGDFYWITQSGGYTFIAVVDCTGHGVPGAFMSMVGHSLLNQIINEQQMHSPATILTELDRGVRHLLQQNEGQNTDGMDLALCRLKPAESEEEPTLVCFSGAKSNIFYTDQGEVHLLRGDRLSIGGSRRRRKGNFTEEAFVLNAGEQIYMATDGYMDQHNEQKQKVGRHRFHKLLREVQYQPFALQHYRLGEYLADHKAGQEQRDDITVLGVRP